MRWISKKEASERLGISQDWLDHVITQAISERPEILPKGYDPDVGTWHSYPETFLALIQEAGDAAKEGRAVNISPRFKTPGFALMHALQRLENEYHVLNGYKRGVQRFQLELAAEQSAYSKAHMSYAQAIQRNEEQRLVEERANLAYRTQQQVAEQAALRASNAIVLYQEAKEASQMQQGNAQREYLVSGLGGFAFSSIIWALSVTGVVPQLRQVNYPSNPIVFTACGVVVAFVRRNWHKVDPSRKEEGQFDPTAFVKGIAANAASMPAGTKEAAEAMNLLNKILPERTPTPVQATPLIAPSQVPIYEPISVPETISLQTPILNTPEPLPTVPPKPVEPDPLAHIADMWDQVKN